MKYFILVLLFSLNIFAAGINSPVAYATGTWTPTYFGSPTAGVTTYTTQTGYWTLIGNILHFTARVTWTNATGTSAPRFGGLPFTCNATAGAQASISYIDNYTLAASNIAFVYVIPGTTTLALYQGVVGGGAMSSPAMDVSADVSFGGFCITP